MIYDDYEEGKEYENFEREKKQITESIDTLQSEIDSLTSLVEQYKQNLQDNISDVDNSSKVRDDQIDTALQAGLIEVSESLHDFAEELSNNISTKTIVASLGRITEIIANSANINNIIGDLTGNVEGHLEGTADLTEATIEQLNLVNTLNAEIANLDQIVSDRITVDKIDASEISTDLIKLNRAEGLQERTPVQSQGLIKMTIPIYRGLIIIKSSTYALTVHNNTLVTWNMTSTDFAIKRIDFSKNNFGKIMSTDIYLSSKAPYKVLFLGDGEAVETTTEYSEPVELNVSTVQGTMTSVPVTLPDSEALLSAYIVDEIPEDMLPNAFYMVASENNGDNGTWYFDGVTKFKIAPDAFNPVVESITTEQIVDTTDETGGEFDYLSINDTGIEWKHRVHNDYSNSNPNNLIDSDTLRNYNGQWFIEEQEDTNEFNYTHSDDPETVAGYFSSLGTPVVTERPSKAYPEELGSFKKWLFNPTDSWTIYTTDFRAGNNRIEIKDLSVMHRKQTTGLETIVYVNNPDEENFELAENVDYMLVPTSSIEYVMTIDARDPDMTEDSFKDMLLATGLFTEDLHPIQTIFLSDNDFSNAFGTDVYLYFDAGEVHVYGSSNRTVFLNDVVLSTIESEPVTTVNPITKLGTVDEGDWKAGSITTSDLSIKDDSFDFNGTEVKLSDMNSFDWVEV